MSPVIGPQAVPKSLNQIPDIVEYTTKQLVDEFGTPKNIDRSRANALSNSGKRNFIFCTMYRSGDSDGADYGEVGMHVVNVMERYEFEKELPPGLYVNDIDYDLLG
jgi:hypothetical protein